MKISRHVLTSLLCGAVSIAPLAARGQDGQMRQWTDSQGRKVTAAFAGREDDSVLLKLENGQTVSFPLIRLSAEDQAFVRQQSSATTPAAPAPAAPVAAEPPRLPIANRVWPQTVEVPARSIEISAFSESPAERKFVYRSEAFEFVSQAKLAGSVMKEVARTFEATRALINALPWGVVCRPPVEMERFQALLYETREDYQQAGGPPLSGGVYSRGDKTFKVPFPSIGLIKRGQTYFKDENYRPNTLVHEITHQMMDEYLTFLPTWIIEGTAEYTEMLPLRAGTFRADAHKTAVKATLEARAKSRGGLPEIDSVGKHVTMDRAAWDASASTSEAMGELYARSLLLVYFFCHLDGDKKGTRFLQFMDAVHGEVAALRAFFADPRVKQLGGGRFTYPRDFPPPEMDQAVAPFKHLPLLLGGRDYETLAREIVEGYKSIGMKVQVK